MYLHAHLYIHTSIFFDLLLACPYLKFLGFKISTCSCRVMSVSHIGVHTCPFFIECISTKEKYDVSKRKCKFK